MKYQNNPRLKGTKTHTSQHIVFLGEAGFPKGLGAIQRMTLVAKALIHAGSEVKVICRKGVWDENDTVVYEPAGHYLGIEYAYTSRSVFRPNNFFKRNIEKLIGMAREFSYLRSLKKKNELEAAFISSMSSFHVLRYRIYSFLIGFPVILNFVELGSVMKGREGFLKRVNDLIFDRIIVRIVDGALPISEKLMNYYRSASPTKPCMKLPILCDFENFFIRPRTETDTVFLYCGAASYFELVDFLISAFDQLQPVGSEVYLDLILGGKAQELNRLKDRIKQAGNREHIRLMTNVPHKDIPGHYARASALLIPLRPTLQDEARFPHKIGEYLASGRPIITTPYGEIRHYDFLDGETALVADDYDVASFADKMHYLISHPEESETIGVKGREMGLKNFDYTRHGSRLRAFFNNLKG